MRIVILDTEKEVANYAAEVFVTQIKAKPRSVIGLATGGTPLMLYASLIESYKRGNISFSECLTFNLDEYVGLDSDHPQSYSRYMRDNFFQHIDLPSVSTNLLDGAASNLTLECTHYESLIFNSGGVDIQLLGIGRNGHIGFNEPSSSLASRTRVKTLSVDTVSANKRFFGRGEFQPSLAMTMGIGTIMDSKKVLLLATGREKAKAIENAIEGPLASNCPASVLQMHKDAILIVDNEAAGKLKNIDYYKYVEAQRRLSSNSCEFR